MARDKTNVHLKNIIYSTKLGPASCCGVVQTCKMLKNVGHIKQNKNKKQNKKQNKNY